MRRLRLPAIAAVAALAATGLSFAYWTASGSGAASAALATFTASSNVQASTTAGSASVSASWTAASLSTGQAPTGYYVTRRNTATGAASAACGSSPSSLISATSCTDSSVPSGSYTYTVVAVFRSWTATSAPSGAVTVQADATAPTSSASSPAYAKTSPFSVSYAATDDAGGSGLAKVDLYVKKPGDAAFAKTATSTSPAASGAFSYSPPGGANGSYAFYTVATDGAGNAETTSAAQATTIYDTAAPTTTDDADGAWRRTAATVKLTPTDTGPAGIASTTYRIDGNTQQTGTSVNVPAPADHSNDGVHTITYSSTDKAGNVETSRTATVKIDTTAPGGGSVAYTNGFRTTLSVPVTLTDPTDSGSGIASRMLQRKAATPLADGVCPAFTAAFTDLASAPASSYSDTAVATNTCYQYQYVVADAAGNSTTLSTTGPSVAKVDATAPAVQSVASQQSNGTAGNGKLENGDRLVVTFTEALQAAPSASTITEARTGNGIVALGIAGLTTNAGTGSSTYLGGTGTKTATCTGSAALSNAAHTVTVTVGTCSGDATQASTGTLTLTPLGTLLDLAGNGAAGTFTSASSFALF